MVDWTIPKLFAVFPNEIPIDDPRVQQIERLLDELAKDYNVEKGDVVREDAIKDI